MKYKTGDIDIDFPNRSKALSLLEHTSASIIKDGVLEKHNTGVYFHSVPVDPVTDLAIIDYESAEERGWFKVDLLNVGVYEQIKDEQHLVELMNRELNWDMLQYTEFTEKLIHLGNHSQLVADLKPKNINELAMVLALIRPGKRYLVQKCKDEGFDSIEDEIWEVSGDSYYFKKSHSVGYATLVYVHANLLIEQLSN